MQAAFGFLVEFPEELLAQQRAAIVTFRLARGERLTTRQVAEITGITYRGAWEMMWKVEAAIPEIGRDEEGCWQVRE